MYKYRIKVYHGKNYQDFWESYSKLSTVTLQKSNDGRWGSAVDYDTRQQIIWHRDLKVATKHIEKETYMKVLFDESKEWRYPNVKSRSMKLYYTGLFKDPVKERDS
jgi:hypothetical protein